MYLIVGLGNPGTKYDWTRHNVGFETINKLSFDLDTPLKLKKKLKAEIFITKDAVFAKPMTYMNLSGEAVYALSNFYNIPTQKIVIITDEIDFETGRVKIQKTISAGGHNGMKSIIAHCGVDMNRIRIGVGLKPKEVPMADYVLGRFFKEEHDTIIAAITKASDAVICILKHGMDKTMNEFNKGDFKK